MDSYGRIGKKEIEVYANRDELRRLMQVKEVQLNRVPAWLKKKSRQVVGVPKSTVWDLFFKFGATNLLDHWGMISGESDFISEPYVNVDCIARDFQAVLALAKAIDCRLILSFCSWWYPGRTIRLTFFPNSIPPKSA